MQYLIKILIMMLVSCNLLAQPFYVPDGLTGSYMFWDGNWSGAREGARLASRWNWDKTWFQDKSFWLRGYWEGAAAYWTTKYRYHDGNDDLWSFSFSPVLQVMPRIEPGDYYSVFAEIGIGLAVFTDDQLGDRELGSAVHFEDRLGLGVKFGSQLQYEVSYRFMHYSNAGLFPPNNGLDWNTVNVSWIWGAKKSTNY